ncbi:MAG: zinc ribbon domain-containing protein [Dehalococcoidales bacterium]|nr:zinc ribbon domain-containing protein [Dehalococcoidales bacterium]
MPIYEYACPKCGLEFELLRPLSDADKNASCPKCNTEAGRKLSKFASFSKSESGEISPIASSCPTCSANSCDMCQL